MSMKKFLSRIDKLRVYEVYYISAPKDEFINYEKITRGKMHESALDVFKENPQLLTELVSFPFLKTLKVRAQNVRDHGYFVLDSQFYLDRYRKDGLFLVSSYDVVDGVHQAKMPDTVVDYLVDLELDEALKERIAFKDFVFGCLEVYGVILFEDINRIYQKIRPTNFKQFKIPKVQDYPLLNDEFLYEDYRVYQDALMHPIVEDFEIPIDINALKIVYDYQTYLHYESLRIPGTLYNDYKDDMNPFIFGDNMNIFIQKQIQLGIDVDSLELPNPELLMSWPLWIFGGHSFEMLLKMKESALKH